jgi:tetratricopeptide (TPR) repeat protein
VKLLTLVDRGEDVPHLRDCKDCADFVATARATMKAFANREEIEKALSDRLDEVLADTYGHRMTSAVRNAPELHRSIVIHELLHRADECYGSNPTRCLDLTNAAVVACDAMAATGNPPEPELRIEVLKEHSTALRQVGSLDAAISALGRAVSVVSETREPELHRAVLSLCAAIIDAEPDRARFEEAIDLAETAAAVLEICGDERRAVIARQTKAYVLTVTNRFAEALPLLRDVVAELDRAARTWASARDIAAAYNSLAHCLVGVGSHYEASGAAALSARLYSECGSAPDAARAAHCRARAIAALGQFDEARGEFARTAEVVFEAKLFDEWAIMRLEYAATALAADPSADVRVELESIARVCMTLGANTSNARRQYAAEAMAYLRQLAMRDAVTFEVVDHVRTYVARNASRPPVKFTPPPGGAFLM